MVALKGFHAERGAGRLLGSRNAVVALKPSYSGSPQFPGREKQERRGGIETSEWIPALERARSTKQERRGGIETDPRLLGQRRHQGSRNAVVALKLVMSPPFQRDTPGSRNAVVALKPAAFQTASPTETGKQERRGGIETRIGAQGNGPLILEAGTPWWH